MALSFASLNSGSNGNCYYVGNDTESVLIDAGISCRELMKRMDRLGLDIQTVQAVFISHEHSDHIKGVETLSNKFNLPVYITSSTHTHSRLNVDPELLRTFRHSLPVEVGKLTVHPFSKHHDAAEPHSFMVSGHGLNIGVLTDIGIVCDEVIRYFSQCHAAFLESNYDEKLLSEGRYPYFLKKRITGGKGHLSNRQALDLFVSHRPVYMRHLILSHLSKENNCPNLVENLFKQHAEDVSIVVASRHEETALFYLSNENNTHVRQMQMPSVKMAQLSLF